MNGGVYRGKMCRRGSASLVILTLLSLSTTNYVGVVWGWGARFNRFLPQDYGNLGDYGNGLMGPFIMSNNDGFSGDGGRLMTSNDILSEDNEKDEVPKLIEDVLKDDLNEGWSEESCSYKKCTANEHCCDGHVCVDSNQNSHRSGYGECFPIYGKKEGEKCYTNQDCESGFRCMMGSDFVERCHKPKPGKLKLGEDCQTSSECSTDKGLCCKLQRRAKSQSNKICSYFTDPLVCIGPVIQHETPTSGYQPSHRLNTAGEKRLIAHPDYYFKM